MKAVGKNQGHSGWELKDRRESWRNKAEGALFSRLSAPEGTWGPSLNIEEVPSGEGGCILMWAWAAI